MSARRVLVWGPAGPDDLHRFPARPIRPSATPLPLPRAEDLTPPTQIRDLLDARGSRAFLWVQDGRIRTAHAAPGRGDALHTSFSVARSLLALMIGAAIADGHLGGTDDRLSDHLPELHGREVDALTLGDLLAMQADIAYRPADGLPLPLAAFSDDALTYFAPDLRRLALRVRADRGTEGFHYDNFHPLLLGLVLERATGERVSDYLERRLWQPLGAAHPASWSLDSVGSGFEKMESGSNAHVEDDARLGLLVLNRGRAGDRQVLPEAWIDRIADPGPSRPWHRFADLPARGIGYGLMWWVHDHAHGRDLYAHGNHDQIVHVAPHRNAVVVRPGESRDPAIWWPGLIRDWLDRLPEALP